ncbi:hypothetical protein CEXT_504011 [Caerostris extrusa]|uniref:Uncharacterized protein n=1 Tax=Caerostris extrusa TaxID=172846 RepID=A0AAV4VUI3_CAEEX|nr:hypothetical protein CEXT_504011 [Caerostris extrusa]
MGVAGAGLGCVFGGLGFDYLGGHQTFRIAGIFGCGFLQSRLVLLHTERERPSVTFPSAQRCVPSGTFPVPSVAFPAPSVDCGTAIHSVLCKCHQ